MIQVAASIHHLDFSSNSLSKVCPVLDKNTQNEAAAFSVITLTINISLSNIMPKNKWNTMQCIENHQPVIWRDFSTHRPFLVWQQTRLIQNSKYLILHTVWHPARYIRQGPLNIWTEHSNCQIHSRGDSKTPIASLIPNIFLIFYEIIFLCI